MSTGTSLLTHFEEITKKVKGELNMESYIIKKYEKNEEIEEIEKQIKELTIQVLVEENRFT